MFSGLVIPECTLSPKELIVGNLVDGINGHQDRCFSSQLRGPIGLAISWEVFGLHFCSLVRA